MKTKQLTYLVLLLVALNIITLSVMFMKKKPHPKHLPSEQFSALMDLSSPHKEAAESILKDHRLAVKPLFKEIRITKRNIILLSDASEEEIDSNIRVLLLLEEKLAKQTLSMLNQLDEHMNEEQKNTFKQHMLQRGKPDRRPPPPQH